MLSWPKPSKDAILLIKPERRSGLSNLCWEREQQAALASLGEVGCPQGMGEDAPVRLQYQLPPISHTPVMSSIPGSPTPAFKVTVLDCKSVTAGGGSPVSVAFCGHVDKQEINSPRLR